MLTKRSSSPSRECLHFGSLEKRSLITAGLFKASMVASHIALFAFGCSSALAQTKSLRSVGVTRVANASRTVSGQAGQKVPNVTAIITPNPISFNSSTGVLSISGDSGANIASAEIDRRGTANTNDDQVVAKITLGNDSYSLRFPQMTVKEIYFQGYQSNDRFLNATEILSRADGGAGDDWLSGGQGGDFLYGGPGNDFLYGGLGNDQIYGGPENDNILGCDGSDSLYGEDGDDTITDYAFNALDSNIIDGGLGKDLIHGSGEQSFEEISGGPGADTIYAFGIAVVYGNEGDDIIYGTPQGDLIYGQDGHDIVYAGDGNDRVFGGSGPDWLYGENGSDAVLGDSGDDLVAGGAGNDFVYGGDDDDTVQGGENDDFAFGGDGADYVLGDAGRDVIGGGYAVYNTATGDATVLGDNHSDWNFDDLWGGPGKDLIFVADKKHPWVWLDDAVDATHQDLVQEVGWIGFLGEMSWHPE